MTAELVPIEREVVVGAGSPAPLLPWRDPHAVPPEDLAAHIAALELACERNPKSVTLRTCLGMAHAMNFDIYKSMDALETAVRLDSGNFWARQKLAELWYRLRALNRAEEETLKAVELAGNWFELSTARRQLQEIRRLKREGAQKPEWTASLRVPAALLGGTAVIAVLAGFWK